MISKGLSFLMLVGSSGNRLTVVVLLLFQTRIVQTNIQSERFCRVECNHFISSSTLRRKKSTAAGRMSVAMSKVDGVTVLTLSADPQSTCPPFCQIFNGLCYSPVCCSVSQHLKSIQKTSQSDFGAMHIMIGLLNIGLGSILERCYGATMWELSYSKFPFWIGAIFILFGIMNILSEKYPSPCLVILNVILNLAGVAFAIAAIVLYSINTAQMRWRMWWMCDYYRSRYRTPSPREDIVREKCMEGRALILMLLQSVSAVLIVLSVLELCIVISYVVLGIKALRSSMKREVKSTDDPEH